MVITSINHKAVPLIYGEHVKYAISIEPQQSGGPGNAGRMAPTMPAKASMIANTISMTMTIVMLF